MYIKRHDKTVERFCEFSFDFSEQVKMHHAAGFVWEQET